MKKNKNSSDGFVPVTSSYDDNIKQISDSSDGLKGRKFIIISVIFLFIFIILIRYIRNIFVNNKNQSKMFEKYILNNKVEVKNRLVIAPITLLGSNSDGTISEEEREYLKIRGTDIGIYILGSTAVSQEGITFLNQPRAYSEKDLPSLEERAKIIKSQGALAINQIHHGGALAKKEYSGIDPVAPSGNETEKIHELTDDEIKKIIEDFAYAAELSLKAGFDGVEIHGANKFIIQQFYSGHTNHRNDNWGGTDEKRMNFALKIVDAICNMRDKNNRPDFIIGYRLSPEEPYEDGITMTETLKLVRNLLLKPIQYIHISQKNYFREVRNGEGKGIERLKVIHNEINGKIALIGVGGLRTEKDLNSAFNSGFSEFVGVGIASMLNKDFGILLKQGKGINLNSEFDKEHPEKYSLPSNLWKIFINHHK